jgi:hypothetical protein
MKILCNIVVVFGDERENGFPDGIDEDLLPRATTANVRAAAVALAELADAKEQTFIDPRLSDTNFALKEVLWHTGIVFGDDYTMFPDLDDTQPLTTVANVRAAATALAKLADAYEVEP